jgi:hypothetical protein
LKKGILLIAALCLLLVATSCGAKEGPQQLTEAINADYEASPPTDWALETEPETPPELDETEAPTALPTDAPPTAANSTKAATSTSKASTASKTTVTTKTTAKTSTKATTTTTKKSTTTTTTKHYDNPISINSQAEALSVFNKAVKTVVDQKAGFSKSHTLSYKDWNLDPGLTEGLPSIPLIGDVTAYFESMLSSALNQGVNSATAHKGDTTQLIRASTWGTGDMKSVNYSPNGSDWVITLEVKDGSTRQQKKLLSSGISGNSPIDSGPLHMATGDYAIYDHMRADRIFSLIKDQMSIFSVDPIDISESTSQIKFVANIDGEGKLTRLTASFNQTVTLAEISILIGNTYKNSTGSASVKVTFSDFVY